MNQQRRLGLFVLLALLGLTAVGGWLLRPRAAMVQAARPEAGGWMPDHLMAKAGEPLHLRLTAVDMMHGFMVGQMEMEPIDIPPGETTEITLLFDEPGTYTYYCTRFCGPTHWRMRGTIEVLGEAPETVNQPEPPLYVMLGMDIDADHTVPVSLERLPSAEKGAALTADVPERFSSREVYESQSPYSAWVDLKNEPGMANLTDAEAWDIVAYLWQRQPPPDTLASGQTLYEANCASCHGLSGAGDGPLASIQPTAVPDFTDPTVMLGANSAILQGKLLRGGMGTGMPNWGTIFTDAQIWALVDYLWTFQFTTEETIE